MFKRTLSELRKTADCRLLARPVVAAPELPTVDLSALAGLHVHPTDRIYPRYCRVVPELGACYDAPLDGRPLAPPGCTIRHVFVDRRILATARALAEAAAQVRAQDGEAT